MPICMQNILKSCNQPNIDYNKLKTSGNDPSNTKAQRLSQYIRTTRHTKFYPNPYGYLDDRGLVYKPYVDFTLAPTNVNIINNLKLSREKFFVDSIQRTVTFTPGYHIHKFTPSVYTFW
jgi:hypothetical protein